MRQYLSKKLLKSGAIVSAMTLISRILGLVRDMVVANILGAGAAADVFLMANKGFNVIGKGAIGHQKLQIENLEDFEPELHYLLVQSLKRIVI